MPAGPDDQRWGALGSAAIILLPIACCALPLLIASGALGGLGAALGNPWIIGTAAVLLAAPMARRVRRHPAPAGDDCCAPPRNLERPRPPSSP
jgi:hypothetical protein